jgi:Zn-dependent peptidase ImmA (M78 family)/DNA-binding XRE family transcriptional regulator
MDPSLFEHLEPQYNKERIRQARELTGLTQQDLADRVKVKQATIAKIERGWSAPSADLMGLIARETKLPISFFTQDSGVDFGEGTLLFRAKASMTRKQELEAKRHAEILLEFAQGMAAKLHTDHQGLQAVSGEPPVEAALTARKQLGLDDASPIPHLIRAIEKVGGYVLALPPLADRDAFATWAGSDQGIPVIAISAAAPADRLRFSVAHELGHLLLHKLQYAPTSDREKEADEFAAEFTMPAKGIRQDFAAAPITLEQLGELKTQWGISIAALARRAFQLGFITERRYRYLFQQLNSRGWRMQEPPQYDIPKEKPRSLRKMAEVLYGTPLNYARISADMNLTVDRVKDILDRYADETEVGRADRDDKIIQFNSSRKEEINRGRR